MYPLCYHGYLITKNRFECKRQIHKIDINDIGVLVDQPPQNK